MAVITLSGERRTDLGKGGARKARAAGRIPGIVYGHEETPIPVAISARELQLALRHHKGSNAIVSLAVGGGEVTALIRQVQYDPLSQDILHLDFQRISLTETIEVNVTVHLIGVPTGVKDGGGVLEPITREVEVRCLPTAIPSSLEVDVTHLGIGDSVHVRDLKDAGVEVLTDAEVTLATVVAPTVHEDKPAGEAAAAPGEAGTEPEVIAKGKKDEDEADAKEKKS